METKWTEGPWRAEGPDMFGDWNILHQADALAIGAVVSNLRPADEVAANAHMFAAAPDYDDAAQCYVRWVDEFGEQIPDSFRRSMDAAFGGKLRAALKKARGE